MPDKIIYLDNASTTIPYEEVLESYNKASTYYFANASSIHKLGQESNRLVDLARRQILDCVGLTKTHDAIFTSGATEANNLAIVGYCLKHLNRGKHIITTEYEHPSVLECFRFLERHFDFKVTYLKINKEGQVELNNLLESITDDTILVSIMAVNNEIGTVNDIASIAKELKKYPKIVFHVDAVQSITKTSIKYDDVDLITITSHKIHGPKGIGCLLKRQKLELESINNGGGQENGYRSGTLSTDLIVAFAKALKISKNNEFNNIVYVISLHNYLIQYLKLNEDLYEINSFNDNPYIVNFSLKTKKASVVVEALSNNNIIVSSISACHSKGEPFSYVVSSLGKSNQLAHNTIRVSFDAKNTMDEVNTFIQTLDQIVREVK